MPSLSAFGMTFIITARRTLSASFVDFTPVVPRPLIGIGEQVVSRGDLFEPSFRLGLTRIDVRVKLLGEIAVDLADLVGAGVRFDAQHLVGGLRHPVVSAVSDAAAARWSWPFRRELSHYAPSRRARP